MHMHFSIHQDHNHNGLLGRVARDLVVAMGWITGPGMSRQQLLNRAKAEARSQKYGYGIF